MYELVASLRAVMQGAPCAATCWGRRVSRWADDEGVLLARLVSGPTLPEYFAVDDRGDLQDGLCQLAFIDGERLRDDVIAGPDGSLPPKPVVSLLPHPRRLLAEVIRLAASYAELGFDDVWAGIRASLASLCIECAPVRHEDIILSAFTRDVVITGRRRVLPASFEVAKPAHEWLPEPPPHLVALLGAKRATLLLLLAEPATRTQLTKWLGVDEALGRYHLKTMAKQGLAVATGQGAKQWCRTSLGTDLIQRTLRTSPTPPHPHAATGDIHGVTRIASDEVTRGCEQLRVS